MELRFAKWQGTGNDFILVDDRAGTFPASDLAAVRALCDRHFGIGSDGLILVQAPREPGTDFHMEFFNPDGSKSFCGNGSRCAFAFWRGLHGGAPRAVFTAVDGAHEGMWAGDIVAVTLRSTGHVARQADPLVDFLHNGSPHELVHVDDPDAVPIMTEGPLRRYAAQHKPGGTNVNFMHVRNGEVGMRTYERGVEAETLSCGTGVVAAAISALDRGLAQAPVTVRTRGGVLRVEARRTDEGYADIRLIGPVGEVFTGTVVV